MCLGARAVFVGRPVLWGLAHDGETGVYNVLKLLNDEFVMAMKLTGSVRVQVILRFLLCISCCDEVPINAVHAPCNVY